MVKRLSIWTISKIPHPKGPNSSLIRSGCSISAQKTTISNEYNAVYQISRIRICCYFEQGLEIKKPTDLIYLEIEKIRERREKRINLIDLIFYPE
jgi:hypothetical protein